MKVLNIYHTKGVVPDNAVYIGRANAKLKLPNSGWGNPFVLKNESEREAVVETYRQWLDKQVSTGAITVEKLLTLAGKDLVCFCAPKACHGDVLKDKVQWAITQRDSLVQTDKPPQATVEETANAPKPSRWKRG